MEDWPDEPPQKASRPTLRPVFVAALIVAACVALAVWTLQNPTAPTPAEPTGDATETPTRVPVARKDRTTAAAASPRSTTLTATPTPRRALIPTAAPATAAPIPTLTPPPLPSRTTAFTPRPHEAASLTTVAPPKVKRGISSMLDVRGRALRPDHRVVVLRGGRVPAEIGVPRQKLVDSTLIQVLIIVGPGAPKGEYDVAVADGEGRRSNRVHFEVIP
jgi:hypothetical protein